jgi:hypothetical protein
MIPERDALHTESAAALDEAFDAFERNPVRGTPQWSRWRKLCRKAAEANKRYVEVLGSPGRPLKRDSAN